jgi:GT2 family glycosyltransferase
MMKHVAVLMTCHNRKPQTLSCLQNLFGQQGLNQLFTLQVYLVDDGSTDGTGQDVAARFPAVKIIQGSGELYWNRGMHTAWKAAATDQPDFYLWLNDDTELYADALVKMLAAGKATNYESIICGSIESPTKKGELTYGGGSMVNKKFVLNYPDGEARKCDIINGNCVLIAHSIFVKVGNLDWRFVHAIGDHDYGLRAMRVGISSLSTGSFVAKCATHDHLPKWCLPKIRLRDRIKNLYSPLGYSHPHQFFIFEQRHFGTFVALKHYLSIHLRVFIPQLWT